MRCNGGFIDEWSLGLWEQFSSVAKLLSDQCLTLLVLFMTMIWICTTSLETLHASVRRAILACSVQAPMREFGDVQCAWLAQTFRRLSGHVTCYTKRPPKVDVESTTRKRKPKRKRLSDDAKTCVKQKQRRKGGAWRLFVRYKLWGSKGRKPFTMMAAIAREYRELTPFERERWRIGGKIATRAARHSQDTTRSAFGLRGRDVVRAEKRKVRQSMRHLLKVSEEGATHLAKVADVRHGTGSVADAIAAAKLDTRLARSAELHELLQNSLQLVEYQEKEGAHMQTLWDNVFAGNGCKAVVVPVELGHALRGNLVHGDYEEKLKEFIGNIAAHSGGEGAMNTFLDKAFNEFNMGIVARDCPATKTAKAKARWCRMAGMCLCDENGRRLYRFRESMHSTITKPAARPGTEDRVHIKEGRWLIKFVGEPADPFAAFASDAPDVDVAEATYYFHICYHTLSPWRSTWSRCVDAAPPPGEPPSTAERIYTKVSIVLKLGGIKGSVRAMTKP